MFGEKAVERAFDRIETGLARRRVLHRVVDEFGLGEHEPVLLAFESFEDLVEPFGEPSVAGGVFVEVAADVVAHGVFHLRCGTFARSVGSALTLAVESMSVICTGVDRLRQIEHGDAFVDELANLLLVLAGVEATVGAVAVPGATPAEIWMRPNNFRLEPMATEPPATEPETTPAPTTTTGEVSPAMPDESPYVVGFGDLSVVSLPDGDPGAVTIVASTVPVDRSSLVSIIVRNNTNADVGRIEVTGTARDGDGTLAGSGTSQGFQPQIVAPGEIAFGYVFFGEDMPDGSTFEFDVDTEPVDDYFLPVTITEVNNTGDQIVGLVKNDTGGDVSGPISAEAICFGTDGSILDNVGSYVGTGDDLPADTTGSFAIDLYSDPCPIGLVAASGYGDF